MELRKWKRKARILMLVLLSFAHSMFCLFVNFFKLVIRLKIHELYWTLSFFLPERIKIKSVIFLISEL